MCGIPNDDDKFGQKGAAKRERGFCVNGRKNLTFKTVILPM